MRVSSAAYRSVRIISGDANPVIHRGPPREFEPPSRRSASGGTPRAPRNYKLRVKNYEFRMGEEKSKHQNIKTSKRQNVETSKRQNLKKALSVMIIRINENT